MEVLVGVILSQLLKTTSGEMTAQPGSHEFVVVSKLYCLARPMYLKVLALAERPRDADAEARGQREVVRVEGQRSKGQRGPKSKSRGPRLAGSGP